MGWLEVLEDWLSTHAEGNDMVCLEWVTSSWALATDPADA
jgi:hemerythrin